MRRLHDPSARAEPERNDPTRKVRAGGAHSQKITPFRSPERPMPMQMSDEDPSDPAPAVYGTDNVDLLESAGLFTASEELPEELLAPLPRRSQKRKRSDGIHDTKHSPYPNNGIDFGYGGQSGSDMGRQLPELQNRVVNLCILNPFAVSGFDQHPRLLSTLSPVQVSQVHVSGLIKFRLQFENPQKPQKTRDVHLRYQNNAIDKQRTNLGHVVYLPKDFGSGLGLDEMDSRLLKFYLVAFCAGRTLLEWSNVWKNIPAIAQRSGLVKHAMLSKAAGYVLDYAPSSKLRDYANRHHKRAVALLGAELNNPGNYEIGKEEPLLMALALLNNEDLVHWEAKVFPDPKWYFGNKLVKYLLDKTDPGYHYQSPVNVQSSINRYCMSHYQMKSLILSDTCAPLEDPCEENPFAWLLEGNEREVRRITGLLGTCPKLLHMLSQITHMSWQLTQRPESRSMQTAGKILLERLVNFQQWSELTEEPFETTEELFEACQADFDDTGKVKTARLSVALNAESFVQTARCYLLCRFFRLPRRHPEVQKVVADLIKCTDWVPLEGPLYTAQDSLFGLAIAGILAIEPEHRAIVRGQFAECESGPRGNDTPVWYALERIWLWLDTESMDAGSGEEALADRVPWWELMVNRIYEKEGRLSLL